MPKVYNKHHKDAPPDASYVGRPSKYGNPFVVGTHGDRKQVIELYGKWLAASGIDLETIKNDLKGKDLVCWCAPAACHADILLEIANAE